MVEIMSLIEGLLGKWGAAPAVLMWIGVLRLVFKPTFTWLGEVVKATPSEKDNEILKSIMESKVYSSVVWVLDLLGSIKLPVKK